MEKRLRSMKRLIKENGGLWPNNYIFGSEDSSLFPPNETLKDYYKLLDKKCNENAIHNFIAQHPIMLACMMYGGKGNWVFSKPKLGDKYVPDFLMCTQDSGGFHWALVELESPNKKALRKDGQQSAHLSTAIKQINEWRIWLRKNIAYARHGLGFIDIDAECPALIVIGRRKSILPEMQEYYRELSNDKLKIMSYDRLAH